MHRKHTEYYSFRVYTKSNLRWKTVISQEEMIHAIIKAASNPKFDDSGSIAHGGITTEAALSIKNSKRGISRRKRITLCDIYFA